MIDAAERLIDRQRIALGRIPPEGFFFVVAPYLRALHEEPSIRVYLDDLEREAKAQVAAYEHAVEPLHKPILRAWERLTATSQKVGVDAYLQHVSTMSELRDGTSPIVISMTRSDGFHTDAVDRAYSAAYRTGQGLFQSQTTDETTGPVMTSLDQVGQRIEEAVGVLNVQTRGASFSLLRLMNAAAYVPETQRPPRPLFTAPFAGEPETVPRVEVRPLLGGNDLTALAASRQPDIAFKPAVIQRLIVGLSEDFAELHDALALMLGTVQSRLALIDRFSARCERYDRQRLADLADQAPGKPEAVLRDELARYLFDAGLDPLTEASLATTRADLLDVSGSPVLVEAKQYSAGGKQGLTKLVQEAYMQTVDTAAELGPREVGEAFVVIFRRAGGRLILPKEPVRLRSTDYVFRLVDLAPSTQTGSRATDAVTELTAGDITRAAETAAQE